MLLPLSHDSNVPGRPWVCLALIAAMLAGFAAGQRDGADEPLRIATEQLEEAWRYWDERPYLEGPARLVETFGPVPARPDAVVPGERVRLSEQAELDLQVAAAKQTLAEHDWYRFGLIPNAPRPIGIVGHLFLHGGWIHLLANLWFLWLAGPLLEQRLGRLHFALLYFASGLAGAALFVTRHFDYDGPLIGASGAVAGVLGAFLVTAGRARVRVLWGFVLPFGSARVDAALLIALWFAAQLASALWSETQQPGGVATWAHVGGFGFGMLAALALRGLRLVEPVASAGDDEGDDAAASPAGDAADLPRLRALFAADGAEAPDTARFAAAARAAGRADEVAPTLTAALWSAIGWRKRDLALAAWKELAAAGVSPVGKPEALLQLSGWLRAAEESGEASHALELALRDADAAIALRIARSARKSDPVVAHRAAERALALGALPDAEQKELRALAIETRRTAEARGLALPPAEEAPSAPAPAELADPSALDPDALGGADDEEPKPEAPAPALRELRVTAAVPLEVGEDALVLQPYGKGRVQLAWGRVAALALAGVKGLSGTDKAVLILDLAAQGDSAGSLRLVRIRSDGFDPRALSPDETSPLRAMRFLADRIAWRARAPRVPDAPADAPIRIFPDLASYEREVWGGTSDR